MIKRKIVVTSILIFFACLIWLFIHEKGSRHLEFNSPQNGFVPDATTAIKIAEIIGVPIFGKNFNDYKPLHADLKNDSIWHVYGLPKKTWTYIQVGGCPDFEIQKKDGKVLKVKISR